MNDKIEIYIDETDGFLDPYSSYLEFEVVCED